MSRFLKRNKLEIFDLLTMKIMKRMNTKRGRFYILHTYCYGFRIGVKNIISRCFIYCCGFQVGVKNIICRCSILYIVIVFELL